MPDHLSGEPLPQSKLDHGTIKEKRESM